jgi:hypothetical protein
MRSSLYPPPIFRLIIVLLVLQLAACKKIVEKQQATPIAYDPIPEAFFKAGKIPGVATGTIVAPPSREPANVLAPSLDLNNGEDELILGEQLSNPYLVSTMQVAYNILYSTPATLSANFKYVKFRPANTDQLTDLEDVHDIELQDYPMDYEVLQDGDYYQDPTLGTEDIPWLYAVVPIDFVPPAGINYQVINNLYIPGNDLDLEAIAESLIVGASYEVELVRGVPYIFRTDVAGIEPVLQRPVPCPEEPSDLPPCGTGGGSGGYNPPQVDPQIPRGQINVFNQIGCNAAANGNVAVKQARIVCKRWFKIWRGYTDNQGNFVCSKRFKNKVKVIVKTKNSFAKISKVRGLRFWQMIFPVKRRIGVFNQGELASISYVFQKPVNASASSKELPYWAAATQHNSVVEFREYSTGFNLPLPPTGLKILVTNWANARATGSAIMYNKCGITTVPSAVVSFFLTLPAFVPITKYGILLPILRKNMDITLSYLPTNADYNCALTSVSLKNIAFHELGHAQHYGQAGCGFWGAYRGAIVVELSKTDQSNFHPYGTGNDANTAPIIATGEMWGNHCEYIYSNRHWGTTVPQARMQGNTFTNITIPGLNAYQAAIERFNPNDANDIWRWIPQGLPYDLGDNRNDNVNIPTLNDNVLGYTNLQRFSALQVDIRSIPLYRQRLLQQNGNAQLANVNTLFLGYGY